MRAVRFVVVHHPADDNIQLSLRDHVRPPFTDAPYDWWLEHPTGDIVKGRSLARDGAHVRPDYTQWNHVNNRTAIGVAFEGNFDDERPPIGPSEQQIERGAALIGQLCAEHGIHPYSIDSSLGLLYAQGVVPHRLVSRTACPGRHFMSQWAVLIGKVRWYYFKEGAP
jgi:hypothetical protein